MGPVPPVLQPHVAVSAVGGDSHHPNSTWTGPERPGTPRSHAAALGRYAGEVQRADALAHNLRALDVLVVQHVAVHGRPGARCACNSTEPACMSTARCRYGAVMEQMEQMWCLTVTIQLHGW